MPPSRDIRTLNRADLLKGLNYLFNDPRPMATRNTRIQEIDDYQLPLGMMTFGPGGRLPVDPRHVFKPPYSKTPRITPDALKKMKQLENIRTSIGKSWEHYSKGEFDKLWGPEQLDEVGELVAELTRQVEPYKRHIENLNANKRVNELLEYMFSGKPLRKQYLSDY